MIRKITLLFLFCLGIQNVADAQLGGQVPNNQNKLTYNPALAAKIQAETNDWVKWNSANNGNLSALLVDNGVRRIFHIPVKIHVIMPGSIAANPPGSAFDPSDATLKSMIDYINQSFRATWGAYPDTANGGTFIPIQFDLAMKNVNCVLDSSIERIDGSVVANYAANGVDNGSAVGASEVSVKNLSRWPVDQYYNIWIVNKIDGKDGSTTPFTTAYAYNPTALGGGAPANKDGLIVLASQAQSGKPLIVQQMGFAFGLLNTFFGSTTSTCPVNNNCLTDGDQVCDTEPELNSNGACPTGINSCTNAAWAGTQHNFMDLSSCANRFTVGQRTRMIWAMYKYRGGLIGSTGVTVPSAFTPAAPCYPTFNGSGNTLDAGVYEVKIQDNYNSAYIGNVPYVYMDYSSGGYNTDGNVFYVDHTCTQKADLQAGNTYKFFVKAGPTPTGENVAVYIDYNNDGTFASNELVFSKMGSGAYDWDSAVITLPTSATMPSLVTCLPLRMRVIADTGSSVPAACGNLNVGQTEDYVVTIKGAGVTGSVTVTLPPYMDSSCNNDTLTFTAVPSASATPIKDSWYVNGIANGDTLSTFTTNTIADGNSVEVKMFFNNQCGTLDSTLSNAIVVHRLDTILPVCNIALIIGSNPSCPTTPLTFHATGIHGGSNPAFQWYVNGVMVTGANTDTFLTSTLNAFDTVTCRMITTSPCAVPATVYSNQVVIYHYLLTDSVSLSVYPNQFHYCSGRNIIFTANPVNAGVNPTFQWYVKHYNASAYAPVAGATSQSWVINSLQNLDEIMCIMNSSSACVVNHIDTSNQIIVHIDSTIVPSIYDSISSGQNPWCLDSTISFGGTETNFGANPNFTWLVNGNPVGSNFSYTSNTLQNGDVVTLRVNQTDAGCYTSDTLYSTPITLTLIKTPDAPLISLIGTLLVCNVTGNEYKWYYNTANAYLPSNVPIASGPSPTYHPTIIGYYYVKMVDTSCDSKPSNIIKISLLDVQSYNLSDVKIFPNPSSGIVSLDWGTHTVNAKLNVYNSLGQGMLHEEVNGASTKNLDLSAFPDGNYFIEIRDELGNLGTTKITLSR